jgi:hypothetical protein
MILWASPVVAPALWTHVRVSKLDADPQCVHYLLEERADVEQRNKFGGPELHGSFAVCRATFWLIQWDFSAH